VTPTATPAADAAEAEVDAALSRGYIRPEIADKAVPIDSVQYYPGNARRGNHAKIRASLRAHGQYKTLLVQASTGYVLIGNNTLQVMREDGYTEVAVDRLDVDDARARDMLLIDNASSDDAEYEKRALAELLAGVEDWDAAGWLPDDLDDLLAELGDQVGDLDALAAGPNAPAGGGVLPAPPSTDAGYAEPPEAEAARADRLSKQTPHYVQGLEEMILLLGGGDRAEATRLIAAAREWLGGHLSSGDVVLRALRALTVIGDERHTPGTTISVGHALKAAGYTDPLEEAA
jgi:hypothetical protein